MTGAGYLASLKLQLTLCGIFVRRKRINHGCKEGDEFEKLLASFM